MSTLVVLVVSKTCLQRLTSIYQIDLPREIATFLELFGTCFKTIERYHQIISLIMILNFVTNCCIVEMFVSNLRVCFSSNLMVLVYCRGILLLDPNCEK